MANEFFTTEPSDILTICTKVPFEALAKRLGKNCIMRVNLMWVAGYMSSMKPVDDTLTECAFKVRPAPYEWN